MTPLERAAVILAVVYLLIMLLTGCAGVPGTNVDPQQTGAATAEPTITAGDNARILQRLETQMSQLQLTLTNVTNNFALDKERAKLQGQKMAMDHGSQFQIIAIFIGFIVILACCDAVVAGHYRAAGLTLGIAILIGALAVSRLAAVLPQLASWISG